MRDPVNYIPEIKLLNLIDYLSQIKLHNPVDYSPEKFYTIRLIILPKQNYTILLSILPKIKFAKAPVGSYRPTNTYIYYSVDIRTMRRFTNLYILKIDLYIYHLENDESQFFIGNDFNLIFSYMRYPDRCMYHIFNLGVFDGGIQPFTALGPNSDR